MITESMVYWILTLDSICRFLCAFAVCSGVFAIAMLFSCFVNFSEHNYDAYRTATRFCCKSVIVSIACFFSLTFIPSTKQMAMIKVIPAITNSEIAGEMSKDAKELYKMGVDAIKEQLTSKEVKKDDR